MSLYLAWGAKTTGIVRQFGVEASQTSTICHGRKMTRQALWLICLHAKLDFTQEFTANPQNKQSPAWSNQ